MKKFQLHLLDSLSGTKVPVEKHDLNLYACGITPYNYSHIGHARSCINTDLLVRFLKFLGHDVTLARNFTDIDDKLLNRAQELYHDKLRYHEIAKECIADFHAQMEALTCQTPDFEPYATTSMASIIEVVTILAEKGYAYKSGRDWFFDLEKYASYGKLSKKNLDDLVAGSRVDVQKEKRSPFDFVLWKGSEEEEFWPSEKLGNGRPGWHIECSAMIHSIFGTELDIHLGGADLIFPHHENEIAQSECAFDAPLARIWFHNEFLNVNKEKMSKSLKNDWSMKDFFSKQDPQAFKLYILMHHYRMPIEFEMQNIAAAEKNIHRLAKHLELYNIDEQDKQFSLQQFEELSKCLTDAERAVVENMIAALCDDLNSAKMIGFLFAHLDQISKSTNFREVCRKLIINVLGLEPEEKKAEFSPKIMRLIKQRNEARAIRNWKLADEIRDELKALGVEVNDKKL